MAVSCKLLAVDCNPPSELDNRKVEPESPRLQARGRLLDPARFYEIARVTRVQVVTHQELPRASTQPE